MSDYGREEVILTLMHRDGLDESEAQQIVSEMETALLEAIEGGDFMAAEEIFTDYTGLEPDYMMGFIP